ncbi:MAG: hypothetical protein HYV41_00990 [Candidatus Magasanikbacteria bacterium]|nr:hypothetical protein [Candidatus Magasanikbacteria bacterium]
MKIHRTLTQKILILISIIFVGILMIVLLVIIPSIRYIHAIKNTIELNESRMEEQYQKIRLLKKSISELSTIKHKVAIFDTVLIASGDELSAIRLIEKLAETYDVSQQFKLSGTENTDTLSFDLSVTGSYSHILNYLRGLETFPYYVSIEKMILTTPPKEKTEQVTITFSATFFRE